MIVFLFVWLTVFTVAGCDARRADTEEQTAMEQATPASEIASANLICRLEVRAAEAKPWTVDPANPSIESRAVGLQVRVTNWLKGDEAGSRGQSLRLDVRQRRPVSGRVAQDYGPWSQVQLEPGAVLLALCEAPSPDTPVHKTLAEYCQLLIASDNPAYPHAFEDVRYAMNLQADDAFPASLQTEALQNKLFSHRQRIGPLLMRFLIDRFDQLDSPPYELMFRFLEARDCESMTRVAVLDDLRDRLSMGDGPQPNLRAPLIRAMTGIMAEPLDSARVLREGIQQAYLYNTTFDEAGEPYLSAKEVFADPDDLQRAVSVADLIQNEEHRQRFIAWLKQG